jgi:hypothetical protein
MTNWKYVNASHLVVSRLDEDGRQLSCLVTEPSYLQWILEGNITEVEDSIKEPLSISPWQIRKALNQLGLRDQVEAAVASTNNRDLKDGWEFATVFIEDAPFVQSLAAELNFSAEALHQLFQLAESL